MLERPETRYAWNGDVALAYQVFGDGPVDLVYLQGYASHVDLNWASPHLAGFLTGLGYSARVIHTDRRGWGCSDRFSPGDVAPLEVQVDDLVAVMDAAGSERAVIFGSWETGMTAILFAAGIPDRTAGLILCDPFVGYLPTDETPWMYSEHEWDTINEGVRAAWGTSAFTEPGSEWHDEREWRDWFLPWTRASVAPGALIAEFARFRSVDVRGALPAVQVPTLVVGATSDDLIQRNAAFVAERIAGATLIEPPIAGIAWFHWYGRARPILDAVGELLADVGEEQRSFDRVLATVMFTDVVDSTAQAAAVGDARWRDIRSRHDQIVRSQLARYRGQEIKTMGDGFLATFDGPARGIRAARAIAASVRALGIEVRADLHTGEVAIENDDIAGLGVAIGARVAAIAGPSEVLVSQTVKDLVAGSGLTFEDAGEHDLKGVPDRWRLFRVTS